MSDEGPASKAGGKFAVVLSGILIFLFVGTPAALLLLQGCLDAFK